MPGKKLKDLIKDIDVVKSVGNLEIDISGVSYDSRKVEKGSLFVCIEGFKTDGHMYASDAVARGASAVVAQKEVAVVEGVPLIITDDSRKALALIGSAWCGYPSEKLHVVGVTGTNGKTTTTFLIEQIFREDGHKTGLIGTIMNKVGEKILPVTNTTPESLDLQFLLKEMVDSGVTHVVMEVSSHALELKRVEGVLFDTAVFTNITQDHLDFHHTMENYLNAKKKLFVDLGSYSKKQGQKYGIINIDDNRAQEIVENTRGKVLTYGVDNPCNIRALNIDLRSNGTYFDVSTPEGDFYIQLQLTGLFNVYNSLAAIGAGLVGGVSTASIKKALESVKGVPGRMEKVDAGQSFTVLVDYAHTPDGLENIILAARKFTRGRVITVFGCGGDRDRTKRPIMGEISGRLSDYTVLTSDNPRTEEPIFIISQIEEGIRKSAERRRYSIIPDRREAIDFAIKLAKTGDVVLIAGKGHETYQIVNDKVLHFDDREVARELLNKMIN